MIHFRLLLEIYIPELYVSNYYTLRQPFPRYPILSRSFECQISQVDCENVVVVFIQNIEHKVLFYEFSEDLNKFYESSGEFCLH